VPAIPWSEEEDEALQKLITCGRQWNTAQEAYLEWRPLFEGRRSTAAIRSHCELIGLKVPLRVSMNQQLLDEYLKLQEEA